MFVANNQVGYAIVSNVRSNGAAGIEMRLPRSRNFLEEFFRCVASPFDLEHSVNIGRDDFVMRDPFDSNKH
jgi:hypothetical protein